MSDRSTSRSWAGAGIVVAYAAAIGSGVLTLATGDRTSTTEYPFLLIWSLPPALLVYPVARRLRGGPIGRAGLAVSLGVLIGIGWTAIAYILSGGYLLAADFPVLWCWTWGAIAGLLITSTQQGRQSGIAAGTALLIVAALSGVAWWWATRPSRVVDVVLHESATPTEIEQVWQEVLSAPHPGGGYTMLDGIAGVGRVDTMNFSRLIVTMDPWASRADSANVDARLRQSPLVASIWWRRSDL